MPLRQMTEEGLKTRVRSCTLKIGVARRQNDTQTLTALRDRRALATRKLAERHNVWTLINPEGHTEFVDYAEWEHRMLAWARRNRIVSESDVPAVVATMRRMAAGFDAARQTPPAAPPTA